ncbi:hypothetical protein ABFU82_22520 [Nocardioides sp. WV_118_6]
MPWRGPDMPGEFPTLGYLAAEWIEDTLRFTDGPKEGQPVRLYEEQVRHLLHRYRLDPNAVEEDGNDAFVRSGSMIVRGQKWGKDPLIAMIDLFHAFGPCDYAGWDAGGEAVGRPHPSPWIFIAALNDRQTDNTWLPLKAMVENSDLVDLPGVEVNLDLIRLPCGNPIEPLTTTAFGRLGGRFTAGSLTENGLMTDTVQSAATGGARSPLAFARTLIRSVLGMRGMWVAATNTWDPTAKSHAQRVYDSKPGRVYIDAKISRGRVDIDDDDQLRDELLYLYGDAAKENGGHVSIRKLMEDCRDTEMHGEADIRRFFLSEILAGDTPLCTPERWATLYRGPQHADHRPLKPGEAITLGFDGSRSRDRTTLTATRISDGRVFHLRTWIPACMCGEAADHEPAACKDRKVPRDEVDQAVSDAFAGYEVWYLFGDPYKWGEYMAMWAARWPNRVVEVPTNVESRMDDLIDLFETARDRGEITHDGNADLEEHVRNAAIAKGRRKASKPRIDADGKVIDYYRKVVKKAEGVFIDAAISMLLAYYARSRAIEDGALTTTEKPPPPAPVGLDEDSFTNTGEFGDAVDWNSVQF